MKKILTLLLICTACIVWGQKVDPVAKRILDTASEKLGKSTTFYIKFNYLYTVPGQDNVQESGRVYSAGEKYHLILPSINQIFDGNKIYTISREDKEVTISDYEGGASLSPTNILNLYKTGFDISMEKSKVITNLQCDIVKLVPTDTNKSKSIILALNQNRLIQVIENYNDGSSLTLTIVDFKENLIVNKSLLSFNKDSYKNYIITEL